MGLKDSTYFDPRFQSPWEAPEITTGRTVFFGESQSLISLHPFTITNTNSTPTVDNVGGRPCMKLAGAGAATDGNNFCYGAAGILLQAGKPLIIRGSFRSADIVNHEIAFGAGVVGVGMIATDPTDHVMIRKLTGETVMSARSRKASGTANAVGLNPTLVNDAWYDFAMRFTVDSNTVGAGRCEIWLASGVAAGGYIEKVYNNTFGTNVPDVVKIAPFCAFRAGSTVTTNCYFGHHSHDLAR